MAPSSMPITALREGRVHRLFIDYGFIKTVDGTEIYFHRNSVANKGFRRLKVGSRVRYTVEEGEKGPQASIVRPPRRRRAPRSPSGVHR
jgi:cold shock CspA family protein